MIRQEVMKIIVTIVILLLCFSSVGIGYYIGVEQGRSEGAVAGANYGANAVAQELCINGKTFSCDNGKVCGCFNIMGGENNEVIGNDTS